MLGDRVAVELLVKGNKLSQAVPPADQVISLNLNELLAPVQRDRILLWRYRGG